MNARAAKLIAGMIVPLYVLSVLAAVLLGFAWFMSPLAIGFSPMPEGEAGLRALRIHAISYRFGLPMLAVVQFISVVCAFIDRPRTALGLSLLSLCVFLVPVIWFICLTL